MINDHALRIKSRAKNVIISTSHLKGHDLYICREISDYRRDISNY